MPSLILELTVPLLLVYSFASISHRVWFFIDLGDNRNKEIMFTTTALMLTITFVVMTVFFSNKSQAMNLVVVLLATASVVQSLVLWARNQFKVWLPEMFFFILAGQSLMAIFSYMFLVMTY